MEQHTPPASKRLRPLGSPSKRALNFSTSPQGITSEQAITLKERDPNLALRWTATEDISPPKALKENFKPGYSLSVWPSPTGKTNKAYDDFLQFREEFLLYFHLLQTSLVECLGDSVSFVLALLDHSLRRTASNLHGFDKDFVGEYKSKPFQSVKVESISYLSLLKFIGYLQKAIGTSKNEKDSSEFLQSCCALQHAAEAQFMDLLESLGAKVTDRQAFASQLRSELIMYRDLEHLYPSESREGTQKDARNAAAHPFTILLWTQYKTSLPELEGLEKGFPQPCLKMLRHDILGKVALLLADMERKLEIGALGDQYATALPLAFFLIKEFIRSNNANEREVKWYDLKATIPGKRIAEMPPLQLGGSSSPGGSVRLAAAKRSFVAYPPKP